MNVQSSIRAFSLTPRNSSVLEVITTRFATATCDYLVRTCSKISTHATKFAWHAPKHGHRQGGPPSGITLASNECRKRNWHKGLHRSRAHPRRMCRRRRRPMLPIPSAVSSIRTGDGPERILLLDIVLTGTRDFRSPRRPAPPPIRPATLHPDRARAPRRRPRDCPGNSRDRPRPPRRGRVRAGRACP